MKLGILLGVTGLLFDIMGAWFISKGLVKKNLTEIRDEAPKFMWGVNLASVIGVITQRAEATVGFVLMSLGFVFQASTYVLYDFYILLVSEIWIIADVFCLVLVISISDIIIKRSITKARKKFLKEELLRNKYSVDNPMDLETVKIYLNLLKIKFGFEAPIETLWPELLSCLEVENN